MNDILALLYLPDNFYVLKDYQCDCPVPCDSTTFKPALSYAAFPSGNLVSSALKTLYPNAQIVTPEIVKLTQEYMRYVLGIRKNATAPFTGVDHSSRTFNRHTGHPNILLKTTFGF